MNLSKETTKKILLIILFAGLLFGCLSHISMIGNLFKGILGIAKPFILGLCFAFIMNVLLRPIERLWDKYLGSKGGRNIKRLVCLLSSTLIIIGSVFILFFIIVPEVHQTSRMIVDMFPQYKIQLEQWWLEISIFFSRYNITLPQLEFDLSEIKQLVENYLVESGHSFIGRTFDFTKSVFTGVFNVVLGFVFSFYVLAQKEKLGGQGKKLLTAYCSPKVANKTLEIFSLTSRVFTNFTTGQFTEALIIGVLCFIGMIIFSMPYAPVISVLVGFTALIPVFGAFFGTVIGAFLILMVDPIKAFWFVIYIIVLQQLEGDLIYPKVVGKSVGLPGIWVLMAVTVGGSIGGVFGMLLGVPICSIIYFIIRQETNQRLKVKKQ